MMSEGASSDVAAASTVFCQTGECQRLFAVVYGRSQSAAFADSREIVRCLCDADPPGDPVTSAVCMSRLLEQPTPMPSPTPGRT